MYSLPTIDEKFSYLREYIYRQSTNFSKLKNISEIKYDEIKFFNEEQSRTDNILNIKPWI